MKFNNILEAHAYRDLQHYHHLIGIYYTPKQTYLKNIFTGMEDFDWSKAIHLGVRGTHPEHEFKYEDLQQIEYWAGFQDGSIVRIDDILQDKFLADLCQPGGMSKDAKVGINWNSIRIPKGLDFRILFSYPEKVMFKIHDLKDDSKTDEFTKENPLGINKLIRYWTDNYKMKAMEQPVISFKLSPPNLTERSINIRFETP